MWKGQVIASVPISPSTSSSLTGLLYPTQRLCNCTYWHVEKWIKKIKNKKVVLLWHCPCPRPLLWWPMTWPVCTRTLSRCRSSGRTWGRWGSWWPWWPQWHVPPVGVPPGPSQQPSAGKKHTAHINISLDINKIFVSLCLGGKYNLSIRRVKTSPVNATTVSWISA